MANDFKSVYGGCEPESATDIGIDRDIPITKATPRAIREAARCEPLMGSSLECTDLVKLITISAGHNGVSYVTGQ